MRPIDPVKLAELMIEQAGNIGENLAPDAPNDRGEVGNHEVLELRQCLRQMAELLTPEQAWELFQTSDATADLGDSAPTIADLAPS